MIEVSRTLVVNDGDGPVLTVDDVWGMAWWTGPRTPCRTSPASANAP